ncbi:MAG: hypothetical protein ACKVOR_03205 [Flavobacteriales bacterium]
MAVTADYVQAEFQPSNYIASNRPEKSQSYSLQLGRSYTNKYWCAGIRVFGYLGNYDVRYSELPSQRLAYYGFGGNAEVFINISRDNWELRPLGIHVGLGREEGSYEEWRNENDHLPGFADVSPNGAISSFGYSMEALHKFKLGHLGISLGIIQFQGATVKDHNDIGGNTSVEPVYDDIEYEPGSFFVSIFFQYSQFGIYVTNSFKNNNQFGVSYCFHKHSKLKY